MWVRHQNKKALFDYTGFAINKDGVVLGFQGPEDSEGATLGIYESEERAFEVLNLLQNNCRRGYSTANMPQE